MPRPTLLSSLWLPNTNGISQLIPDDDSSGLWAKRLQRRDIDPKFESFLKFLDTHGALTTLSEDEWIKEILTHLSHIYNRQFWFQLSTLPTPAGTLSRIEVMRTVIPREYLAEFDEWQRKMTLDNEITDLLHSMTTRGFINDALTFRGVPLAPSLVYLALPEVLAKND